MVEKELQVASSTVMNIESEGISLQASGLLDLWRLSIMLSVTELGCWRVATRGMS